MTFPRKLLCPGEEIHLDSRPNWSLLFWPAVLTLVVIGACVAVGVLWSSAPTYMAWVLLGCGLAALLYFGVCYLAWVTTSFVVTSQRIVYRTGVLRRTGREIPIGRVQDVTYHQTIVERVVRAGSLTVESAGRHGQDPFPDITRPAEVQSLINRVVSQAAGYPAGPSHPNLEQDVAPNAISEPTTDPTPRTVHAASEPDSPPVYQPPVYQQAASQPPGPQSGVPQPTVQVAPSIAQQMGELADLHKHGVITDAEYEQKRRELLDRL